MYQVFDSELFGIPASPPLPPLPPVDDDYALQRYRDPGDDIDDVLGFLGLGLPPHAAGGGQMDGTADDPAAGGGGWGGCTGDGTAAGTAGRRGALGGQLMDSDDCDYVDYSCFSSGVTSPNLDSEFFAARAIPTSSSMMGGPFAAGAASSAAYHPWEFAPISSSSSTSAAMGLRSHSPYFHLETSSDFFRLSDRGLRGEEEAFDSEAEVRVREIARYLASFEVQSWPNADRQMTTEVNGSASSFSTSMMGTNNSHLRAAVTTKSVLSDGGRVFHPGYDDACCGLESTMVNPNEVFPDRIDRSDHQYASRPCHRPQPPARTDRHAPRNNNNNSPGEKATKAGGGGGGGGGVSVLEALLRSNEPIDPNKGSGAAIRLDATPDQSSSVGGGLRCCVVAEHKTTAAMATTDGVLKKLLTARAKDPDSSSPADGLRRSSEVNGGGSEEHGHRSSSFATPTPPLPPPPPASVVGGSSVDSGFGGRVGQNFGFAETQKQSTTDSEQNRWVSMNQ